TGQPDLTRRLVLASRNSELLGPGDRIGRCTSPLDSGKLIGLGLEGVNGPDLIQVATVRDLRVRKNHLRTETSKGVRALGDGGEALVELRRELGANGRIQLPEGLELLDDPLGERAQIGKGGTRVDV